MTRVNEKLDVMDTITAKFSKQKTVSISRLLIVLVIVLFILGLVATGLLTYHFTPKVQHVIEAHCNTTTETPERRIQEVSGSTESDFDNELSEELTTDRTTTTEILVENKQSNNTRLPRTVIPISYEIFLLPFIIEGNFTFAGNVSILVNVTESTRTIVLHADQLDIDYGSVQVTNQSTIFDVQRIDNDTKKNFFIIETFDELQVGEQYQVQMSFVGVLNDLLEGFYRSSYKVNDTKRWIAATQFQATYARKAFPCFDEPALKAIFQVNIGRSKNMSSISNMPRNRTTPVEDMDGYLWDIYEPSVPMSSYLVAFVVSDFDYTSNGTVAVWYRKGAKNQSAFSLKVGPALLKFFEDYFKIPFPLPKIDMIALPDFSNGAMENWGLITYRESMLLYESGVSTTPNLQAILIVVAHELAHQWFGNLVTPVWWTDLWLNEGFASYMEFLAADAVSPELRILDQYIHELQAVLALDALKSSHQISIEVNDPDEINDIFDRISYVKGSAIIRMMEQFLTSSVFRQGLSTYLKERAYSNAEQDDLWMALSNQAHKDGILEENVTVKEIMDTWTLQTGYPVITVTRNYEKSVVKFSQERFLISGKLAGPTALWWVPINYITKGNRTLNKAWMEKENDIERNIKMSEKDWLLVNVNQTGYYRINYDTRNWRMLIDQLNSKKGLGEIDPKNRAQLLDDSFNLASAGYIDYDVPLNVSRYLVHETEFVPWKAAFNSFDYLFNIFSRSAHFDKFKKYYLRLLQNLYGTIGFHEKPSDSTLKIYTRMDLLTRSCLLGYRSCIMNAILEFQNWRNSADPDRSNPVSANLKSIVYCYAIKAGGQEEWDFAWERYKKTHVGSEKEIILTALGCSREPWILRRYLEWSVTPRSGIRKQDAYRVFSTVSNSLIGQHITYTFLKSNWLQIKSYMGSSLSILMGIFRESITLYPTEEELQNIKVFTSEIKKEFPFAARTIDQLIEQGEANLKWRNAYFDYIVDWLKLEDGRR